MPTYQVKYQLWVLWHCDWLMTGFYATHEQALEARAATYNRSEVADYEVVKVRCYVG